MMWASVAFALLGVGASVFLVVDALRERRERKRVDDAAEFTSFYQKDIDDR